MEIVLTKEDGTEFARFADAEELARKLVDVCVVADDEITKLRDALAKAGDLLFDLWDGDAEMLARYETVQNQITKALKVSADKTAGIAPNALGNGRAGIIGTSR